MAQILQVRQISLQVCKFLNQITIKDVIYAIENAKKVREQKKENLEKLHKETSGFEYYVDNPDLTIHICIEQILKDCKII